VETLDLPVREAYRRMALIRRFEERCLELSRDGTIAGSVHLSLGQEAIPVGAVAALGPDDRVLATYRGHGWALACGVPVVDLLAEICQRAGGVNGGRGGSAHLSAPRYRLLGENSIVGAGVPIAAGVALAARARGEDRVVVVSIGDGAMNQGAVHEGMVFAAARDLPVVIVCENNGWSELTPIAAMVREPDLARRAAGYGIPGRVVDGCDPFAVGAAVAAAAAQARSGAGPVLLECKTVRLSGHYNRDVEHYRPKADAEDARRREPLGRLRAYLRDVAELAEDDIAGIDAEVARAVDEATEQVLAMPEPDPETAREHVYAPGGPLRDAAAEAAEVVELTYQRAINAALRTELEDRPEVLVYGEDVGAAGGIFGVSRGLQKAFGPDRVFDTPISESAILGSAVGAAMMGMRPVVEIMWMDFLLVALDQLVNQAANVRYVSRSALQAPLVVRLQQGTTPGSCAQHSQSLEALLAHIPGLKVGLPATADDGYAMTRAAIADPDPCVLVEARELYQVKGDVRRGGPVEPACGARLRREGDALTILTWGAIQHRVLDAADRLHTTGTDVTVLDLRWLRPLDDEAIDDAVRRGGGRVLVVHDANLTGGFGAEIAARVQERHFGTLVAPVARLGAPDTRIPAAPALQRALVPGVDAIVAACERLIGARQEARSR
jgi:2-oxoisovalerate dehydrogenase E1 component